MEASAALGASIVPREVGEDEFDNQYSDLAHYGRVRFWDTRYSQDLEPFEWYLGYDVYRHFITENIPKEGKIMMAGCGNSYMMEDMVEDGYKELVGSDLSRVVLRQMKSRTSSYPEITYFQGNMLDTDLPEKTYDAVIDKGLFDSILCSHLGEVECNMYVQEVNRLLKDTGVFVCISHGEPSERLPFFEHYDLDDLNAFTPWYIEVKPIEKPLEHDDEEVDINDPHCFYWIYICTKNSRLVHQCEEKRKSKNKPKPKKPTKDRAPNPL